VLETLAYKTVKQMIKFILKTFACVLIREESTAVGPRDESRRHGEHGHRHREGKARKETDERKEVNKK
jgi:hypothetical protein